METTDTTRLDHVASASLYSVCLLLGPGVIAAIITHRHHTHTVWRARCPAGYYSSGVAYYRASKLLNYSASTGMEEAAQCAT